MTKISCNYFFTVNLWKSEHSRILTFIKSIKMTLLLLPWHSSSVNGITVSLKFSMIFLVRHLKYIKSFLYFLIFEEFLVSFAILGFALCVLNFPPMVDFMYKCTFENLNFTFIYIYIFIYISSEDALFKKKTLQLSGLNATPSCHYNI